MMMRDLQRLEQLSSTAALGMWADDVVLVLDRVLSGEQIAGTDAEILNEAADMLDVARERAEQPLSTPHGARSLAATTTALTIAASLVPEQTQRELLSLMAPVLRKAANGGLSGDDDIRSIETAMSLFGMLGEYQLAESNSVLASRKDARTWTEMPSIQNSS